jgi:Ser/Thr protein kinase RdoA (MazF antagonist)
MDTSADSDFISTVAAESGLTGEQRPLGETAVLGLLDVHYGLSGRLHRIPTEKDETFRLEDGGSTYLVKLSSPDEDPALVNLQTACMEHLEWTAPDLPVQRLVRSLAGTGEVVVSAAEGPYDRVLRVMRFMPGRLLASHAPSADQLRECGSSLARLATALEDFDHPRADRMLIWDLKHFHRMRPLLEYVEEAEKRALAEDIFDRFDETVVPLLDTLSSHVIHGDFSPFNVLVDPDASPYVAGVIDFGDVVRSPRIFDISVAMANQLGADPQNPWDSALPIAEGYHALCPLSPQELGALTVSAPARLLLRALITGWRAVQQPEARDYLFSHSAKDWDRLASTAAAPAPSIAS